MKGILLAGGRATRLYPVTRAVSKHLLPVYDKPMFYYPLCTLMQSGVRELLLITNARDIELFRQHLGDGAFLGMRVFYAVQPFALGIADALRIGGDFVCGERCALALGDNVFFGTSHLKALKDAAADQDAVVFGIKTSDPTQYGWWRSVRTAARFPSRKNPGIRVPTSRFPGFTSIPGTPAKSPAI